VGEAENGFEAVEKTKSLAPDLLILDISMPGKGGLEVMGELSSLGIRPKVLVLTMHDSRELSAVVRKSGAAGYVSKSHAARDLLRALGEIFEGGTFFPMEDAGSSKPASSAIT
jgi:DNA-binding NarL/FixJ family response regulator